MRSREELSLQIEQLLNKTKSGLTASEIASHLDSDRGTVNSILYAKTTVGFEKIGSKSPPKWRLSGLFSPVEKKQEMLRHESSETIEIELLEETNGEIETVSGVPCSFCGQLSLGLFCSTRCRNRANDKWRLSKILRQNVGDSEEIITFNLFNPTNAFDANLLKIILRECTIHNSQTHNFLDLWIEHNQNIGESLRCLKQAIAKSEIVSQVKDAIEETTEIAFVDLSKSCQGQIQRAFQNEGLVIGNTDLISMFQIENLDSLSDSVRKKVNSVIERKNDLVSQFAEKKIDELTLLFLGISSELLQWISLKSPIRADSLELLSSSRPKIVSSELLDEFYDLVIAIESHPFLPTWKILENLEIWTPSQLIEEKSCIRSRLIEILKTVDSKQLGRNKKHGAKLFERLLRRLEILDGVVKGHTLEEISMRTGVTRERIRQLLIPVLAHAGVDDLKSLRLKAQEHRQLLASQRNAEILDFQARITEYIRTHPGISIAELNVNFPGNVVEVHNAANRHRALVLETFPIKEDPELEIRADIIQSLRDASLLAFPLTGISYDELLEQGLISGVSRGRILQVFGTWIAACENAEVEPGTALKGVTYVRTYSYKEMLRVVGQFLIDDDLRGFKGGVHSYGDWRISQDLADILPSQGTIRNQVDASWKRVKELAMVELRSTWTRMNGVGSEKHDE